MKHFDLKFTERDLLIVVDVQNDFVHGVLGTERARAIIPKMADFIKAFPGRKIFTMDTHHEDYLQTQEGKHLPVVHTVKGTPGWELVDEVKSLVTEDDRIIEKSTFGSVSLACDLICKTGYDNIYVIGFDTIYCVLSNIVIAKSAAPEVPIHVIASLCACAAKETHKLALSVLKTLQVDVVDDDVPDASDGGTLKVEKKIRVGITFGCFIPLHKGHMSIIQQAESENDRVILGVTGYDMDRGRDFIPFLRRVRLMNAVYGGQPKITLSEVDDRAIGLTGTFSLSAWETWCEELFYNAGFMPDDPHCEYHWYIGEQGYIEKIQALYPEHQFHLMDRSIIPVSGTAVRENPGAHWGDIHPVFQQYLTQNGQI